MDKDFIFKSLVENAIDFLETAVQQFEDDNLKYCIINFAAAVEQFLKARILNEHWTLVVSRKETPSIDKFVGGDFASITLREAYDILGEAIGSGLSKRQREVFNTIAQHRNRMVHFFHSDVTSKSSIAKKHRIASEQLVSWFHLRELLLKKWKAIFKPYENQINDIEQRLRSYRDYLNTRYEEFKDGISENINNGIKYCNCPTCKFFSLELEPIFTESDCVGTCLVCDYSESTCFIVECPNCDAEIFLIGDPWTSCGECGRPFDPHQDGKGSLTNSDLDEAYVIHDNVYCSECDSLALVLDVNELVDNRYLCFYCFTYFDNLSQCDYCGSQYTGDSEDTYLVGCGMCEGSMGNMKDD